MKLIKGALVAIVAVFAAAAIVGILFGTKQSPDEPDPAQTVAETELQQEPEAQEEPEPSAQVFEYDEATVEYGGIKDVAGNAMVTLYLTNRTDATVDVVPENIVVNGQYAVESLTGSVTPIGAGETGAVTLTFGVPVQTPLSGTGDVESLSADLVLVDHSTFERIVYVPVSVTI